MRSSLFQCQKSAIEAQLADPALYGEAQKDALKALILDQAYVARELAELVAEWLALQGQLELAGDEVIEGSLLGSESGQSFTELLEIRAWPLFFPIADYNSKGLHITDPRGTS